MTRSRVVVLVGGPSTSAEVAAELASRPGHTNLRATLVRWLLITVSLTFLGALLAAPLAAVFATASRRAGMPISRVSPIPTRARRSA